MTKGSVAAKRQIFINEMILAQTMEDQIRAYRKAYPTCQTDSGARVQSYRIIQIPEVKHAIEEGRRKREEEIQLAQREERIRIAKAQVAHESELDAQMTRIALGLHTRKVKRAIINRETKKVEVVVIEEEPSETDMIAAADKLYRRKGSYAPTTLKHEGGDTFFEFMKEVAKSKADGIQQGSSKKVD